MGKLDTQSTVTLILNGEQTKTSLRDVTSAVNATRAALSSMNQADNPELYRQRVQELARLTEAQREHRAAIMNVTEAQKGFFSDFKKGFSEIGEMSGSITAGTLIYKGVSSAISTIKDVWNGSEAAFKEAEKTQTQLEAVLKSTAGAAGIQKDALLKLQQVEMDKTGVDDDVIAKAEEMLLTFGNVGGKMYDQAIPAIVDMTSAMNGGNVSMESIQATSIQVGKALNDPINGLTSLRKVGVTFNDQQKEQIKTMQESGDVAGAQAIILRELQKEFGGTAEAIRNTRTGELMEWDTDLGNLQERIGSWIVTSKAAWVSIFSPLVKYLGDSRSEAEKLTDEYNKQSESVNNLQKNTLPLIKRYEDLTAKGSLNKDEQKEIKSLLGQISDVIPSAVTKWDQYGNALSINTKKAKDFVDVQKALLAYTNKDAISAQIGERDEITAQRKALLRTLQSGKTTDFITGGTAGTGTEIVRDLTDKEIAGIRQKLKDLAMDTKKIDDVVAGLTGSYLDGVNKKQEGLTAAAKKLSEMTVGELKKRLEGLNDSLNDTVRGSSAYNKILKDIADTEKLLNETKGDRNPSAAENKAAKYAKELQDIRSEFLQISEAAKKGTVDDLDAQLKVIDDKYNKIVEKLQKLSKDPKVAKEFAADIAAINRKGGLRDQKKAGVTREFEKKQADQDAKDQDQEFKGATGRADNIYDQGQSELDNSMANDLNGVTGPDPETIEARRLKIQQTYAQKKFELEQQHLQDLKSIYEVYSKDTGSLDKKIADNTIKENNRAAKDKEATDKAYIAAKKAVSQMEMDAIQGTAQMLETILPKNSALYKAALIVDKTVAIANINMNTEVAIAKFKASVAGLGPLGVGLGVAYEIASRVAEAAAIGSIVKSVADSFGGDKKKAKKGALIPSGPSHDAGGIDLVNNQTGESIAEMEGGEPIMILSKDTYQNNRMLVNELLYNSQHRNGAPVNVNSTYATRPAGSLMKFGGTIPTETNAPALPSGNTLPGNNRMDELEAKIAAVADLIALEAQRPVVFSNKKFQENQNRLVQITNDTTA